MDEKVSWVQDLGSPTEPGSHQYRGVPLVAKGDDIARAKQEMAKGLSDVIFNLVLIQRNGDVHYALGSIA
jgi:hypothetical protein